MLYVKRFSIPLAVFLLFTTAGCDSNDLDGIEGSGNLVRLDEEFADFDELNLSHSFDVSLAQADDYSVTLRVDDNLVDRLEVRQSGRRVFLGLENGSYRDVTLLADITLPDIQSIELSGASRAEFGDFTIGDLELSLSGASNIEGTMDAADMIMTLSGASRVRLVGDADDLDLNASGASHFQLDDFLADDIDVVVSGASSAFVFLNGRLDAEASGASTVIYFGNPTLGRTSTSGGSSISPGG